MLQQTQVASVLPYFDRWLKRFPDFATLAAASEQEVLAAWQGLGYYARGRNLRKLAIAVCEEHGGVLPTSPEKLRRLPGVGPYTAAAISAFAHDRSVPVLDANITRILARLADFRDPVDRPAGRHQLEQLASALVPDSGGRAFTSALMDLGATICKAGNPACHDCPVHQFCLAETPAALPVKAPKRATEYGEDHVVWLSTNDGLLLVPGTDGRWKGLWRLPPAPRQPTTDLPIYTAPYSILHYRMQLRVFHPKTPDRPPTGRFVKWNELSDVPIPSPHRRAIESLGKGGPALTNHPAGGK